MLNLNSKGTEILVKSNVIERLFEICLDHRSHKMIVMPPGGDRMFDVRNLVN